MSREPKPTDEAGSGGVRVEGLVRRVAKGENMREIFLLRLRDAIAEKEWIIAQANQQLYQGGWRSDWAEGMRSAQSQIDHLTECLLNA